MLTKIKMTKTKNKVLNLSLNLALSPFVKSAPGPISLKDLN